MAASFAPTKMVAGFVADLPAGVREWPGHPQGRGLEFFGVVLTPPPGDLVGSDAEDVVKLFGDIQAEDIMRHPTDGRPWPPCPVHSSGDDETHALDPDVDGWRCPYEGGAWNYGHFGAVG